MEGVLDSQSEVSRGAYVGVAAMEVWGGGGLFHKSATTRYILGVYLHIGSKTPEFLGLA